MFGYKTNGFLRRGTEVPSASVLTATARTFCERDCVLCTAGARCFEVAFRDVDRAFPGVSCVIVSSPFGFPWPGLPQCCALLETGRSVRAAGLRIAYRFAYAHIHARFRSAANGAQRLVAAKEAAACTDQRRNARERFSEPEQRRRRRIAVTRTYRGLTAEISRYRRSVSAEGLTPSTMDRSSRQRLTAFRASALSPVAASARRTPR